MEYTAWMNTDKEEMPGLSKGDLRCDCGSLVARIIEVGVGLKCRRCKRIKIIPLLPAHAKERGWNI